MSKLGVNPTPTTQSEASGDSKTLSQAVVTQGQVTGQQFGDTVVRSLENSMVESMTVALQSFSIDRVVARAVKKSGIEGAVSGLMAIAPAPLSPLDGNKPKQLGGGS